MSANGGLLERQKRKALKSRDKRHEEEEAFLSSALFGSASLSSAPDWTLASTFRTTSSADDIDNIDMHEPGRAEESSAHDSVDINDHESDEVDQSSSMSSNEKNHQPSHLQPAWLDEDDKVMKVNLVGAANGANGGKTTRRLKLRRDLDETTTLDFNQRLRSQHALLSRNNPAWALLPEQRRSSLETGEEGVDSVDEDSVSNAPPPSTSRLLSSSNARLEPGKLLIGRMHDITSDEQARSVVRALDWHPGGEVVAVASLDRTLRLFALGNSGNDDAAPTKLQSIRLEDLPLTHLSFVSNGSSIICSGTKRHFYIYDVNGGSMERVNALKGRGHDDVKLQHLAYIPAIDAIAFGDSRGHIQVVSHRSRQWMFELQCGAGAVSALSARDSSLLCATRDGEILNWDLKTRRCISRWRDHGATHTTALETRGNWVATGSDAGVVNIYQGLGSSEGSAQPLKSLLNLTTEVSTLAFNPDAQILAIASEQKNNALRFVHLPTCTVFNNFPKENTPLSRVSAIAFSPSSAHVAIGTARGKVLLYRLYHYHENALRSEAI